MKFYGIEHLSLVDFDSKLTCTIFTKSCNFCCPFCHNRSLALSEDIPEIPFDEILSFLKMRKKYLDAVCISGGEPTLFNDLPDIIKQIKELGYLIKLDTNGTNPSMIKHLIEENLVDYIAMDIKNDLAHYHETAGVNYINLMNIQESINIIQSSSINYEFRTTLIKEFHNVERIENIKNWLNDPKHYYLQKFRLSENCINQNLHEIDIDTAKEFKKILSTKFSNVSLRGY